MPLIDLKTDLKSLKFGQDAPGGGTSEYLKNASTLAKQIPDIDAAPTATTGFSINNDFGLRGGFLRPGVALDDLKRLENLYLKSPYPGLIFQGKQVALGLLANPLQVWNPVGDVAQTALNAIGIGHIPAFIASGDSVPITNVGPLDNTFTRENTFGIGNPAEGTNNFVKGALGKSRNREDYVAGVRKQTIFTKPTELESPSTSDKMTLYPIYNSTTGVRSDADLQDMIKFHISVVDNDNPSQRTYLHFRGYLSGFSDAYSSTWSTTEYVGRGDSFATYGGGYKRSISLGWSVYCQSRDEQYMIYNKLNYLASLVAPDYSDSGLMRGNLIYLTVGDYLNDVPGYFSGLTFNIPESSPWEIGRNPDGSIDSTIKQLPHMIEVSNFNFTPIEKFIPRKMPSSNWEDDNWEASKIKPGIGRYKNLKGVSFVNFDPSTATTNTTTTTP